MQYTKDELNQNLLLDNNQRKVVGEKDRPQIEACIAALEPRGNVLEIGFGMGYSANKIQEYQPLSHTIIENDPMVLNKAREWAKGRPNVYIIEGSWQENLDNLGVFDTIFCDYHAGDLEENFNLQQNIHKISQDCQKINDQIQQNLKSFKNLKFSDQDLDKFLEDLKKQENFSSFDVADFIDKLVDQGNITAPQQQAFLEKFEQQFSSISNEASESSPSSPPKNILESCLTKMTPEAKLATLLSFEDYRRLQDYLKGSLASYSGISCIPKGLHEADDGLMLLITRS
ncbi:MAG: class I SAM-dependent methyltransferase [Chlamydiota bacterium]